MIRGVIIFRNIKNRNIYFILKKEKYIFYFQEKDNDVRFLLIRRKKRKNYFLFPKRRETKIYFRKSKI